MNKVSEPEEGTTAEATTSTTTGETTEETATSAQPTEETPNVNIKVEEEKKDVTGAEEEEKKNEDVSAYRKVRWSLRLQLSFAHAIGIYGLCRVLYNFLSQDSITHNFNFHIRIDFSSQLIGTGPFRPAFQHSSTKRRMGWFE